MSLNKNIIISAVHNFKIYLFSRMNCIIKSISCIFLSFIILCSSFFGQYFASTAFAGEVVGGLVIEALLGASISAGIVAQIMRYTSVLQSELDSGYGMDDGAVQSYWLGLNGKMSDMVSDGTMSNAQAGYVYTVDSVPVAIICPALGIYSFFATSDLVAKIDTLSNKSQASVKSVVEQYWNSATITDSSRFAELASDATYWISCLGNVDNIGREAVSSAMWEQFGLDLSSPSASFFTTGLAATVNLSNSSSSTIVYNSTLLNENFDYLVLRIPDWHVTGRYETTDADCFVAYYYDPSFGDFQYRTATSTIFNPRRGFDVSSVNYDSGIKSISITWERFEELWPGASLPGILDPTDIFPNWGDLAGLDSTDVYFPGSETWMNEDDLESVVDGISDIVGERVGEGEGAIDIPIDIPAELPIDIPWEEEDFADPPAYPDTDDWVEVDTEAFPPFDPDSDPDPDPDPDPDNPSGGEPPQLPPVNIPALLGLFPFCIPSDIKKAITLFYDDSGSDPIVNIPLNLEVAGIPLINYTLVIDLTAHNMRIFVAYLKGVQIVCFVIALAWNTKNVIY